MPHEGKGRIQWYMKGREEYSSTLRKGENTVLHEKEGRVQCYMKRGGVQCYMKGRESTLQWPQDFSYQTVKIKSSQIVNV